MSTRQPLKGTSDKLYDVILNFNKGIDKKTGDDVSIDSSFKNLKNFYNAEEGYLSKRPGVYNSRITEFLGKIVNDEFDKSKFSLVTNKFGETPEDLRIKLKEFYNIVIKGQEKDGEHFTFKLNKIIGNLILRNSFFLDAMTHYEDILEGKYIESIGSTLIEFTGILVGGGSSKNKATNKYENGWIISRISVRFVHTGARYDVYLELDSVDATMNAYKDTQDDYHCRWGYKPEDYVDNEGVIRHTLPIDITSYNGYSYITSGTNYLVRINQFPEERIIDETHNGETNIIQQIGGYEEEHLYKPTAIELNQIGFNILAHDPVNFINTAGSVSKTKGVFFSIKKTINGETFNQPVSKVPYNSEFYLHVLYTGDTAPTEIKYRPDNGEVDIEKNPYKVFPGGWEDETKRVWKCESLDSDQRFELYIKLGDDEFRTYVDTTSSSGDETGAINEISKLVFSSTHSKVINNQLILYGGHGYLFFSEYDDFTYFPNYFYVYIASEAGEEAVTNISYFRKYYAVFTNKRIKRMSGSFGADDFGIYPLSDYIGCSNGRTVKNVGNNLVFLGNDGLYKLKQGYLGEGTENIEKIDEMLSGELNLNNVVQAFTMNNNYVIVKNDGASWFVYNTLYDVFYEYELESKVGRVYQENQLDTVFAMKTLPFYSVFQSMMYDANGDFVVVPMYNYDFNETHTDARLADIDFMLFRFNELDFLEEPLRHKDGFPFTSMLETHLINMGYPTHTKKFKDLYIKVYNYTGRAIPLYVTIKVDDTVVIDPSEYIVYYDEPTDTYYYLEKIESNKTIDISKALGEFKLGYDKMGNKTVQQMRFRVRTKGRAIKLILRDGYDDYTTSTATENKRGVPTRKRNEHDFSIASIGIVYKLKKVKEG